MSLSITLFFIFQWGNMFQLTLGCSFEKDTFFNLFYLSLCVHICVWVGTEVMGSASFGPRD